LGMMSTWPGTIGFRLTIAIDRDVSKNICDGFKKKGPKKNVGLIIVKTTIIYRVARGNNVVFDDL